MPLSNNIRARGLGISINGDTNLGNEGFAPPPPPPEIPSGYVHRYDFSTFNFLQEDLAAGQTVTDIVAGNNLVAKGFGEDYPFSINQAWSPDGANGMTLAKKTYLEPSAPDGYFGAPGLDFDNWSAFSLTVFFSSIATADDNSSTREHMLVNQRENGLLYSGLGLFIVNNGPSGVQTLTCQVRYDNGFETVSYILPTNFVHYGVGIRADLDNLELWVNGVMVDNVTGIGATSFDIPDAADFGINSTQGGDNYFGSFGQYVTVWDSYLTDLQMADAYNNAIVTPAEEDIGLKWNLFSTTYGSPFWPLSDDDKTVSDIGIDSNRGLLSSNFFDYNAAEMYEVQFLMGAGAYGQIAIGIGNASTFGENPTQARAWGLQGNGDFFADGVNVGTADSYSAGDVLRMQIEPSNGLIRFAVNSGAFTTFGPYDFSDGTPRWRNVYVYFGQINVSDFTGSVRMLSTISEMSTLGQPITNGFKPIPSAGV